MTEYGIPDYDAGVLTLSRDVADYYETVARESGNAKAVVELGHDRGPAEAQGRRAARGLVPRGPVGPRGPGRA